ncbi:glycosyltransferase family 2 protein [Flavobacterium sp. MAHUQ-51]|uniref:glycosyltransferase family 2 protein n=1 Tax=Flavobacterium sp. GCM10022190 TaxID=3252639 RepID=UPI00361725FA
MAVQFAILITTKNRLTDLRITLKHLESLIGDARVEIIICDDGSTDGTSQYIKDHYKKIEVIKNNKNKGLIYSRNLLLNRTKAKYAITLDDDAHFLSDNILEEIDCYFVKNTNCAVMACRIFWGKVAPINKETNDKPERVKGFVGCGHIWRMEAWNEIPNYPEWFIFYGEEEFASFQLYKKGWEVHFTPQILVQHRVEVKARKKDKDYTIRLRRSLRSGWYLYALFYPLPTIPKKMTYSIWMQLKLKVFKGDVKAAKAIMMAFLDFGYNVPRLLKNRNGFSKNDFENFFKIEDTKVYWSPKENK